MCDAFELPWDFIELDLSSVVVSAGKLVAAVALVLLIVQSLYYPIVSSFEDKPETADRLRQALFLVIAWGGITWLGRVSVLSAMIGIVPIVLVAIWIFLLPRIHNREGATFEEKAAHMRKVDSAFPSWIDIFAARHGSTPVWIAVVAVYMLYGAWSAGKGEALRAEQFLTMAADGRSWVVLRSTDSGLVVAAFDRASHRVSRDVRLIRAESVPALDLERVGPLALEPAAVARSRSEMLPR